ncbi:hypothetical protein [Roseomonas elaeocarpi]|uniref:Uncharacterized protein n=1 Tax=Roseomonas elaeocarpi TaxID=907779 RepID=A0ABV6JZ94_9PROT
MTEAREPLSGGGTSLPLRPRGVSAEQELDGLLSILGLKGERPAPVRHRTPHEAIDAALLWMPGTGVAASILAPHRDPVPFRLRWLARCFNTRGRTPAALLRLQLRVREGVHG